MKPPAPLDVSPAYRIYRLSRLLRRHFLAIGEAAGLQLTQEQFFVLDKLYRRDGQSQTELADADLQDRANLTRMVRELESRGLVARRPDPEDGRRKRVHLTQRGRSTYERFFTQVALPARDALFGDLTDEQLQTVHAVFDHLEQTLR